MKYTVIKDEEQYQEYCKILERICFEDNIPDEDEKDLVTVLIEKWQNEHYPIEEVDPVKMLKYLMDDHKLKAKDIAEILELSKGTVSKILNYQKGLSKRSIRILSERFKMQQEAFNRPYPLQQPKIDEAADNKVKYSR